MHRCGQRGCVHILPLWPISNLPMRISAYGMIGAQDTVVDPEASKRRLDE